MESASKTIPYIYGQIYLRNVNVHGNGNGNGNGYLIFCFLTQNDEGTVWERFGNGQKNMRHGLETITLGNRNVKSTVNMGIIRSASTR